MQARPTGTGKRQHDSRSGAKVPLPDTDSAQAAGSNILPDIVSGTSSNRLHRGTGQSYRPRLRPMISFMISVVPPEIDRT